MTRTPKFLAALALAAGAALVVSSTGMGVLAQQGAPSYRFDPEWPKTLPNNWKIGGITGLAVDANDDVWLTDAALHQVFKFSHDGELRLTLGEAGIARWDVGHFNRPTDVAVRADGGFYVTDGYEAQRIVQFDSRGRYVREWGRSGFGATDFRLPHGIALKDKTLLIADRENGRLAIYDTAGVFQEIVAPLAGTLVYSVATEPGGGTLIALQSGAMGGIIRVNALGQITHGLGAVPFGSGEYLAAHDLAAGVDGSIYVAETRAGGLRKYARVAQTR